MRCGPSSSRILQLAAEDLGARFASARRTS
jgi:hypothetical protein